MTTVPNNPRCYYRIDLQTVCGLTANHRAHMDKFPAESATSHRFVPAEPTRTVSTPVQTVLDAAEFEVWFAAQRAELWMAAEDLDADSPDGVMQFATAAAWFARSARIEALEAELLRLAGPVCPRDGRRASDHERASGFSGFFWDGSTIRLKEYPKPFQPEHAHPAWPEGEEWLRRSAR